MDFDRYLIEDCALESAVGDFFTNRWSKLKSAIKKDRTDDIEKLHEENFEFQKQCKAAIKKANEKLKDAELLKFVIAILALMGSIAAIVVVIADKRDRLEMLEAASDSRKRLDSVINDQNAEIAALLTTKYKLMQKLSTQSKAMKEGVKKFSNPTEINIIIAFCESLGVHIGDINIK